MMSASISGSPTTKKLPLNRAGRRSVERAEFLRALAEKITADSLSPIEAAAVAFGRLDTARRAARRAWIRKLVEEAGIHALPPGAETGVLSAPVRPAPVLSRLNRSWGVFPPLLAPESTLATTKLTEILALIRRRHVRGEPWPRLLDVLASSSAVTWETAATLLEPVIGRNLVDEEIAIVARTRSFWRLYAQGRARLAALQATKELPVWKGDWGYFDRGQFAALLPGAVLPDHCERAEFLTRYFHQEEPAAVDLHGIGGEPLCRHPFPPRLALIR